MPKKMSGGLVRPPLSLKPVAGECQREVEAFIEASAEVDAEASPLACT